MFRGMIGRLDRAALGGGVLAGLADRVGSAVLPRATAEAAGGTGCFEIACSCGVGGDLCQQYLWCGHLRFCGGDICGMCEDLP